MEPTFRTNEVTNEGVLEKKQEYSDAIQQRMQRWSFHIFMHESLSLDIGLIEWIRMSGKASTKAMCDVSSKTYKATKMQAGDKSCGSRRIRHKPAIWQKTYETMAAAEFFCLVFNCGADSADRFRERAAAGLHV